MDRSAASDLTTALHVAASTGHEQELSALLAGGAAVTLEARDGEGKTALAAAAGAGQEACVRRLLAAGASPNAVDRHGHTPLHWAAACGWEPCLQALLEAGADVEARDAHGLTALPLAAGKGQVACLQALHAAGASLHALDDVCNNPMHLAACNGHLAALRWLVAASPDPAAHLAARNRQSQTPRLVATDFQQRAAERLLMQLERRHGRRRAGGRGCCAVPGLPYAAASVCLLACISACVEENLALSIRLQAVPNPQHAMRWYRSPQCQMPRQPLRQQPSSCCRRRSSTQPSSRPGLLPKLLGASASGTGSVCKSINTPRRRSRWRLRQHRHWRWLRR